MAEELHGNGSGSLGSSSTAATAVAAPAAADTTVSELLRLLLTKLQQSGGNAEVLQAIAAAASPQSAPAEASARAVSAEQTRIARPGDGAAAQMFTPRSAAASVSSAHSVVSKATGSARTPIMRHTNHDDSKPFVVAAEKASKAPELQESRHYPTWRIAFTNFLASYGVNEVALQLPRYITLPTSVEQLTPEERQGPAGYELHPSVATAAAAGDASILQRAEIEYDKCMFVSQALLHAVQKVALAVSVVAGVPSPNAHEAWRRLEDLFFPQTNAQLDIAEQEFIMMKQGSDEDIASYGARAQLVFNQLALLQAPRTVHQQCSALVRGIVSLSQMRRDLLRTIPQPSFESVVASARQWEQEDLVTQRQQHAHGKHQQNGPAANMADSPSNGKRKQDIDYSNYQCHSCRKYGHISRDCTQKPAGSNEATCDWCGMRGHFESHCFTKRQGVPKTSSHDAAVAAAGNGKQASYAQNGSAGGSAGSSHCQAYLFERIPEALRASAASDSAD